MNPKVAFVALALAVSIPAMDLQAQEFSAGIRFRRHFGYTRKSAQLSWGIDYHDATGKISPDATSVVGHKTSGLSLSL